MVDIRGIPVLWYASKGSEPCVGTVASQVQGSIIGIRLINGRYCDCVRHVSDDLLFKNPLLWTEHGAWDYTATGRLMADLLADSEAIPATKKAK